MSGRVAQASPRRQWSRVPSGRVAGVVLACVLILASSIYSIIVLHDLRRANGWVEHSRQVMLALYEAREAIRDAEIAQRDFLGTGDQQLLTVFSHDETDISASLSGIATLVAADPEQRRRFEALSAAVTADLARMAGRIADRQARGPAGITPADLASRRAATERIMGNIGDMQAEEARLLEQRQADADHRAAGARVPLVLGTLGSLALIGLIFRLMLTEATVRERHVQDRTAELGHAIQALRQRGMELRGREEQLRVLIEATPAAIAMFDRNMRYLAVSQRYRDDYHLGSRVLVGCNHYDVFPEIPQPRRDVHRRCMAGATERAEEEEFSRPDGSIDWLRWEIRPWHDGDGTIGGIVVFTEVITARKAAEQALAASEAQLRQAQKMEVVGQLTGGIAHDFNNMLGVIIGNVEFLQDALTGDPARAALAAEILNVALSGAELTRRLLTFARKLVVTPRAIDFGAYLPEVATLLRRTLGDGIHVSVVVADGLWPAWADQAQVGEALLNLAVNARDAMPQGGRLLIEASNAPFDESEGGGDLEVAPVGDGGADHGLTGYRPTDHRSADHVPIDYRPTDHGPADHQSADPGPAGYRFTDHRFADPGPAGNRLIDHRPTDYGPADYVMVSVTDSGHGMPSKVLERVMEPFFTTKDATMGTGLGLSMVYGFVRQSGGHIKIDSEVGCGTTVRLYFPRAAVDRAGQQGGIAATPAAQPPHGTAAILVVDDNVPMGNLARRHLTALGYSVTLADGGPAALTALESDRPFDLLFTDVAMPDGVTGYALADLAVRMRPGLKVLLTTGYAGASGAGGGQDRQEAPYPLLRKPYRRRELAEQVRTVLEAGT